MSWWNILPAIGIPEDDINISRLDEAIKQNKAATLKVIVSTTSSNRKTQKTIKVTQDAISKMNKVSEE